MNFPGGFVVFLFFFVSEERVPKQFKQASIVGNKIIIKIFILFVCPVVQLVANSSAKMKYKIILAC